MPAKYKLTYFNVRGRAETARCIFAAAGVEYEDVRIQKEQWPALKPTTPFGGLPILEVDGKQIGQSITIFRYIARETGLAGKDNIESALVDSVVDALIDWSNQMMQARYAPEAERAQKLKEFMEGSLTTILTSLENLLKSNKGGDGYFVGDSITWADIYFMTRCDYDIFKDTDAKLFEKFPKLGALNARVRANKGIAAWMKKRPVTDM